MPTRAAAPPRPATAAPKGAATQHLSDRATEAPAALREELVRLVYASRSRASASDEERAADVRSILTQARQSNLRLGITGLLLAANGHYLQVLEGPRVAVDALFGRIQKDARHGGVSLLLRTICDAPIFPAWTMGLIERSEPESVTAERMLALRQRLSEDADVSVADFFRLMLVPSANPSASQGKLTRASPRTEASRDAVSRVAFASPTAMWSAAVLQYAASQSMLRMGRTSVTDPAGPAGRTLIEYLDIDAPGIGPLRALSLIGDAASCAPLALLVERLSVLVFMLTPSDFEQFVPYVRAWLALPQVAASRPHVLILAGLSAERVQPVVEAVRAGTELTVTSASVKLSNAGAVWREVQAALLDASARQAPEAAHAHDAELLSHARNLDLDLTQAASAAVPTNRAPAAATVPEPGHTSAVQPADVAPSSDLAAMLADSGCLQELLGLPGVLYAAVLDTNDPRALLCAPESEAARRASLNDTEFLCAKLQLVRKLNAAEITEDIVLTTRSQLQVFRSVRKRPTLFLAVTLGVGQIEMAAVRMKLRDLEAALDLLPL
jgi:Sensors of blue-light using FAD